MVILVPELVRDPAGGPFQEVGARGVERPEEAQGNGQPARAPGGRLEQSAQILPETSGGSGGKIQSEFQVKEAARREFNAPLPGNQDIPGTDIQVPKPEEPAEKLKLRGGALEGLLPAGGGAGQKKLEFRGQRAPAGPAPRNPGPAPGRKPAGAPAGVKATLEIKAPA